MSSSSAFLYEPRAAFYTEKGLKSKTKCACCQRRQENFQPQFQRSERLVKKTGNRAKK
jgi:hypothetical protein